MVMTEITAIKGANEAVDVTASFKSSPARVGNPSKPSLFSSLDFFNWSSSSLFAPPSPSRAAARTRWRFWRRRRVRRSKRRFHRFRYVCKRIATAAAARSFSVLVVAFYVRSFFDASFSQFLRERHRNVTVFFFFSSFSIIIIIITV